jgi:FolB domain-containing protein
MKPSSDNASSGNLTLPTATHYSCVLSVRQLQIAVRLGVPAEERASPQPVEIDVRLFYPFRPEGMENDRDTGYFCYAKMCEWITELCHSQEFNLIEYLTRAIYDTIRPRLDGRIALWIRLHKIHCNLPGLRNGSEFIYTDLPAGASIPPLG